MPALLTDPLFLLFAVGSVGYLIGRVSVLGIKLGVAAVLFVGIAAGAFLPDARLPSFVASFGLVLFVYTTGLAAGPGFVAALRRRGLRANVLVLAVLLCAFAIVLGAASVFGWTPGTAAGSFAGALTNTPALAAITEALGPGGDAARRAVVAYSLAYPIGVVTMLLSISVFQRAFKVDYAAETAASGEGGAPIVVRTVRVTDPPPAPISQLGRDAGGGVVFSRLRRGEGVSVPAPDTELRPDDVITLIGEDAAIASVGGAVGGEEGPELRRDASLDMRRIFVSSPELSGSRLDELDLHSRFGAVVTRVRRGDVDLLAHDGLVLELGDRVRVVAPPETMPDVASYFGDSYRALSEIDVMTFGVGIALGLALGSIAVPLPGGARIALGIAGGPLVVGLLLGAVHRTGPFVWQLPFTANLTIRQLGTVMFLAAIGVGAGGAFADTFRAGGWSELVGVAFVIAAVAATATIAIGYGVLKIPMPVLTGVLAGLQTQPAVLSFATQQARSQVPDVGYATVYPLAMVSKILLAQAIVLLL